jgi:hypothetical protein
VLWHRYLHACYVQYTFGMLRNTDFTLRNSTFCPFWSVVDNGVKCGLRGNPSVPDSICMGTSSWSGAALSFFVTFGILAAERNNSARRTANRVYHSWLYVKIVHTCYVAELLHSKRTELLQSQNDIHTTNSCQGVRRLANAEQWWPLHS